MTIRIMQRAYALRDAREKERQEFVRQRYDDQWRDSCDDARTLDSKAMLLYMNQERLRQIQEKVSRKQDLSKQENSFLAEWNRQLDELERRDREKNENRQRVNNETSAAIRKQIEDNMRAKESYYTNLYNEEQVELERVSCLLFNRTTTFTNNFVHFYILLLLLSIICSYVKKLKPRRSYNAVAQRKHIA